MGMMKEGSWQLASTLCIVVFFWYEYIYIYILILLHFCLFTKMIENEPEMSSKMGQKSTLLHVLHVLLRALDLNEVLIG